MKICIVKAAKNNKGSVQVKTLRQEARSPCRDPDVRKLVMSPCAFLGAFHTQRARKQHDKNSPTCCLDTLILVPDHFAQTTPRWYKNMQAQLPGISVHLLQMPNPYESNTKRWESVWLGVIRESTRRAAGKVSLLGHGTGADACLRFLENDSVESGVVFLAPTGDEYFAGERHGRSYYWDLIRSHVGAGIVLAPSATLDRTECHSLVKNLKPSLTYDLHKDMERYTNEDKAGEVAKLVRCACVMEKF